MAETGRESKIGESPAYVRPFLRLQASFRAARQAQVGQGRVARYPPAKGHASCPKLLPWFIEVKHKIWMRLHTRYFLRAPKVMAGPFACAGSSWMTSIFS